MVREVNLDPKVLIKKPGIKIMNEFLEKKDQKNNHYFRIGFIRCDCDSEILVVRYDGQVDMLDLCIYETKSSFANNVTLWQKIRYVYHIIRYGRPYIDQIVLKRDQIEELKAFLNTI